MAKLVLGPLLRYVGETEAVIWVETEEECEVEVLGHTDKTFSVCGHHYALVIIDDLKPGSTNPYEVALDGVKRWPEPDSEFPPSVIRTITEGEELRLCFGSCRVSIPHHTPYTLPKTDDPCGREFDALYSLSKEMLDAEVERWPHALMLLGDQVYADEVSPETLAFMKTRRDIRTPPGEEIKDFEEYTRLYRESWSDPHIRWLYSTVSVSMVVDDHDVSDDWNISQAWVEDMKETEWWPERECAGIASYWLYQFVGNLSPQLLRESELLEAIRDADDGLEILESVADDERGLRDGAQWSFCRDFGQVRMIVLDSRIGRVLEEGRRSMLSDGEWQWLERNLEGEFEHVLIGTSDPFLLAPGLHYLERWGEALCGGVWGPRAAEVGEKLRRALDFDHWGGFGDSFVRLAGLLRKKGAGELGPAPESITLLSGDVHHAYLTAVAFPRSAKVESHVWQAVCSPFRNALDDRERKVIGFWNGRGGEAIGRTLARLAGIRSDPIRWRALEGPFFDNQVATLTFNGREGEMKLERTVGDPESDTRELHTSFKRSLVD